MTESEKLIRLFSSHCDTEMVKQFEKAVIEVIKNNPELLSLNDKDVKKT